MEPQEDGEQVHEPVGICQRCGKTFIDVFDFQEDVLPDYVPLRLIEYRETNESTLGEWCSRACFIEEIHHDPQSIIRRVTSISPKSRQPNAR